MNILDSFNRANSAVSLGNADTGETWIAQSGTWGIAANKAYLAANAAANDTAVLDTGTGDGDLVVDVTLSATNNRADVGLIIRDADVNNYLLLAFSKVAGFNQMTLYKRVAGVFTQLGSALVGALVNGTTYNVHVTFTGTSIEVEVDGVSRISYNTATGLEANTKIGFREAFGPGGDDGGSRFDNLTFTPPATEPDAPTDVTATAGDARASVTWNAPVDDGGDAIISYTVTASPGGATATVGGTTATVTGLTNGVSYTFTVAATNSIGTGPDSAPSDPVTPTAQPFVVPAAKPTELVWVYDYTGAQTMALHELLALELDDRLQQSETLRFTIAAEDPKADFVLIDTKARYRDRVYRIKHRDPARDGTRTTIDVEAEALWVDLADRVIPGHFLLTEDTPDHGLDLIILHRDYGWTVGTVDAPAFAFYGIDKTDATILELLREWAHNTGCELVFDTEARTVSLVAAQGESRDLGFRYAWNLRGITRRETPPEVTRLYAYGRNGLTISALSPDGTEHIDDFSYYIAQGLTAEEAEAQYLREKIWKDDAFISDGPLYEAAVARLAALAQPVAAYEAKVIDLTGSGLPVEAGIGDTVPVRDATLGISIRTRVVRLVTRPLAPHNNEIELAYLQSRPSDSSSTRAPNNGEDWLLFLYESLADRTIDSNLSIVADIGLQFTSGGDRGGEAVHHFDAEGVATGTGTLEVTFFEEINDEIVGPVFPIDFTDGEIIHIPAAWSLDGLDGNRLFSVRVQVISGSGTVDFAAGDIRYSILARGALGVSIPPDDNSVTFVYNGTDGTDGTVQLWDVPPDVESVVIDCYGAQGGPDGTIGEPAPMNGGRVRARVPVIAGETLSVFVGGQPLYTSKPGGGFNGGGLGGNSSVQGTGGGGASDVRRGAATLADRLLVAGAGGANGSTSNDGPSTKVGGIGAYPEGGQAADTAPATPGPTGGTQTAGGAGDIALGGSAGADGSLGNGGNAGQGGGIGLGGGGGGAGLYGGGGGHTNGVGGAAAGGGGAGGSSGIVTQPDLAGGRPSTATEVLFENGVQTGHGKIVISWDTPA